MDVNAAYTALQSALSTGIHKRNEHEALRVYDLATAVRGWIDRGGFLPTGHTESSVRRTINKALSETRHVAD